MFHKAIPLFLTCETPLHAGSGDSLGIVDLPIQRERHTSFPKIEASSLKGALREAFMEKVGKTNKANIIKAFGPEENGDEHAGALGFTDSRLLLFPVKSMKGVFAWITCPKALQQLSNDLKLTDNTELTNIPSNPEGGKAKLLADRSDCSTRSNLILEEYTFGIEAGTEYPKVGNESLAKWLADLLFVKDSYWHSKAQKDIILLSDDDFKDFVNLSTEVITRIKINQATGTVQKGALFTEEYLPAESVLYSLVLASPEFVKKGENRPEKADAIISFFEKTVKENLAVFQLGGNATLGKGLLRTKIVSPSKQQESNA